MTDDQIYKAWKHGDSLKHNEMTGRRIYRALKRSGLQVVILKDKNDRDVVYNYVPETGVFYRII